MADEQTLEQQVEEYRLLFDSIPIMLWYKDTENRTIRVNKAAADLEGVSPADIEGKSSYDLYPQEQADAYFEDDKEVIDSGEPKLNIIEKHTTPSTGKLKWMNTGKVPYRNNEGEIIGVVAFAMDITQQKEAEEALREARDSLEKQNRQMSRTQEFFRSTIEQLKEAIQRGADQDELLSYLNDARLQFESMD